MDREDTVAAFEAALTAVPEIRHAERLFGEPDYLLRVVASDLNDYATLRDRKLATLTGVRRLTPTIVVKRIVDNRPLPVAANPAPKPTRRDHRYRPAAHTFTRQMRVEHQGEARRDLPSTAASRLSSIGCRAHMEQVVGLVGRLRQFCWAGLALVARARRSFDVM